MASISKRLGDAMTGIDMAMIVQRGKQYGQLAFGRIHVNLCQTAQLALSAVNWQCVCLYDSDNQIGTDKSSQASLMLV